MANNKTGNGYSAITMLRIIVEDNINRELKEPLSKLFGFEVFVGPGMFNLQLWGKLQEEACRRLNISYADFIREVEKDAIAPGAGSISRIID
jgi:hypothetical protein